LNQHHLAVFQGEQALELRDHDVVEAGDAAEDEEEREHE
jgi:hypothetical protein